MITCQQRYAHLRQDLLEPAIDRFEVESLGTSHTPSLIAFLLGFRASGLLSDRLEGQVRADGTCAIANEYGILMGAPALRCLDND